MNTPAAEITIDEALVRRLLQAQCPALALLPLSLADEGWDNAIWRLGEQFCVRVPRRTVADQLVRHEQQFVPELSARLCLPVPELLHAGVPTKGYPWHWSVLTWLPGHPADEGWPVCGEAIVLAGFLKQLHLPADATAPRNEHRGVSLRGRATLGEQRLALLRQRTDSITAKIDQIWHEALAADETSDRCWLHGDLHARNILVCEGKISGIIDWGDITAGDAATDLASIWMLFSDEEARSGAISFYGPDRHLLARAKGWAVLIGAVLLQTGLEDHPRHARMGRQVFANLAQG